MKFRVICPFCEHTVSAKDKGKAELAEHIRTEHPDERRD